MNIKRNWPGIACCFLVFTAVCIGLTFNMQGAFIASGHPELGLLFFTLPGIAASVVSRGGEVVRSLVGAILAAPICLVVMRLVFNPSRTIVQELAWLLSGVFWCALGALFFLFVRRVFEHRRENKNALRGGR
ncbi:inner membrane protein YbjM [Enterobacteriaceae bacterium H4N4]|uniref:Inner membrane protein YbjM n=1 Tax=Silvania confinis TaxID=2926470 RepID=A0A9J6QIZ4_9ENTR|nr:inner membrane protein YbjM [Silvania confinis]MCU6670833.1 inner membrane protein YbjM [Silvania confinis]